jgi:hypothetical protein
MNNRRTKPWHPLAKAEAAKALIQAVDDFLRENGISRRALKTHAQEKRKANLRTYRKISSAYRDVAVLMANWFTNPKFLDNAGQPVALTQSSGSQSVARLIKHSRVRVPIYLAWEMLTCSPSIKFNSDGTLTALRRVFVLPEFQVPRAALVVERYLETLRRNASFRKKNAATLLERSCFVPDIDLATISPVLRDIKERGTAFMDGVDGEIESCRIRGARREPAGELGVVVFAWTRSGHARTKKGRNPRIRA